MSRKILLYSDSAEYGGHEVMSVNMANALAANYEITILFYHERFGKQLDSAVRQERIACMTRKGILAFIRNINLADIFDIRRRIRIAEPDLVIILQPAIDFCLRGAIASRWLGIKTVSYIPNCFSASMQGARFGFLADKLFAFYYRLFDGFITINPIQKELIENNTGGTIPVQVLENTVEIPKDDELDPVEYSPSSTLKVGVIGRIQYFQKGYDRLLRIAEKLRLKSVDFKIVIIGDGPDRSLLENMIKDKGLGDKFIFKGWLERRRDIYSLVDLVLLASEFEGSPLTMIESLLYQKLVLGYLGQGTQILKEYLEPQWLYSSDDEAVEKLSNAKMYIKEFNLRKQDISREIARRHGSERFAKALNTVVGRYLV